MAIDLEIPGTTAQGVCPLSSMQQSMLWNSQLTPQPGLDIEQVIGELRERLDLRAFERAWQRVIERHAILRTGFRWREVAGPRQEIYEHVPLHFEFKDWRKLGSGKQKKQYAAWLREDRQRGFDLGAPPLMRVTVFGVAEGNYRFVWTFHHVLLDATAFSIVLEELFAFYEALRAGYEL